MTQEERPQRRLGYEYVLVRDSDDKVNHVILDKAERRAAAAAAAVARRLN